MTKEQLKQEVAAKYESRQDRSEHPEGTFDDAGRWYPDDDERCECCDYIRSPSRAYPYSLMVHCRTKKHIRHLIQKRDA